MRSSIASALSAVLLALSATAEPSPGDLDRLLDGMAKSAGFSGQFVEEMELALLTEPATSRGALYFVPPDRMARFTTHPVATALLIDGERVEFKDVDGARLDLSSSPLARHFVDNLMIVFSGDRKALEERYTARFESEGDAWQLTLTPRQTLLSMAVAHITLSGVAEKLVRMVVLDSEGARTVTKLSQVEHDRRFTAAELERLFETGHPLEAGETPQ